jgi:hypothetical protein
MATKSTIKLDTRKLVALSKSLNVNLEQVVNVFAFRVEAEAKLNAPVETHALQNSIYVVTSKENNYRKAAGEAVAAAAKFGKEIETSPIPKPSTPKTARVGPCVNYGYYMEFGRSARPYMLPAMEKIGKAVNDKEQWKKVFGANS